MDLKLRGIEVTSNKWQVTFTNLQCDTRHEKTDLKNFVVVIPKEGWAPIFFWYDTDFLEFDSDDIIDYIL